MPSSSGKPAVADAQHEVPPAAYEVAVNVATLSIGDELVFGEVIDTNAAVIGAALHDHGLKVRRHMTVGDAETEIIDALLALAGASDAVIVSGGLGPTSDDITARAAARATGNRLVRNETALAHLQGMAEKLGSDNLPLNEKQAFLPARATVIPNPVGTACGFLLNHEGRFFAFLPGVPGEMARMLHETVIPFLLARVKRQRVLRTGTLKVFGPSEARVNELLHGLVQPGTGVSLAYGITFPEIFVKVRAEGDDPRLVAEALEGTRGEARKRLKAFIYAEDDGSMDSEVARLCGEKGITLSLAESCTGGLLAKRITDVAGSSAYFLGGVVAYANDVKSRVLGVSPRLLEAHGAVSAEVAREMARGIRALTGSDIALAITGIAGPAGDTPDKPVGTVFIAMARQDGCGVEEHHFHGSREEIRTITAFAAQDWLRKYLTAL